ncbi:MAG: hypothetical protein KC484_05895 [Colwelliaceae bacterium]|nr:hypothetical protein [Colwelliaceae bacterium]
MAFSHFVRYFSKLIKSPLTGRQVKKESSVIGIVIASIILYFVIYRLVKDKELANFKSIFLLVAIPGVILIALRLLLKAVDVNATISLIVVLSSLLLSVLYVFSASKIKFKLPNTEAVTISVVYFFSIWASEMLHSAIMGAVFT